MEDFKIIQPAPVLAPYVKHYWLLKTVGDSATLARTVPTGMMSLIFHRGNRLLSVHENEFHPRAFLSGQEKTFADLQYDGQINMVSVVFRPAGVRAFFSLPINKVAGLRLSAGDMEDKELLELENTLTSTEDDKRCLLLTEQFLLKRLTRLAEHNLKRIEATIRLINSGQADIARLASAACLSTKQFNRIFSELIGTNPKEFSRTIRFQRALHILENNPRISFTALAYECGYFDQSHMIKDFKTLSGYTPSEFLAVCPPHSDYFS
ncbi:helix-turn-helix domain-containing protein [uncultured Proteiniphilum sp.]|uniref:helix-turn-helix domain-containing protein n=1 Tax=uncultured Proteiniphilum sp. TaxID=497637 RepID=UPI002622884A|nr:helix-turn-helix domain-containing protein [uncultured Proteiniphilum sp.]